MLVIEGKITRPELSELAKKRFGDLVKAVVDIERCIIAVGGELHSDEEELLLNQGSNQSALWSINLYPDKFDHDFLEFDSVINLRPSQGNCSRDVIDEEIRQKIKDIIAQLVKDL